MAFGIHICDTCSSECARQTSTKFYSKGKRKKRFELTTTKAKKKSIEQIDGNANV